MARVHYLSPEQSPSEDAPVWARLHSERKLPTGNLFRALAHAPAHLDAFLSYANTLRDSSQLDPRLRELAILAVGHAVRSEYEIAHHRSHALAAGVTPQQLASVADFEQAAVFSDLERAVMRLARESTLKVDVSDGCWEDVAAHLSTRQMVELTLTIAWYNSGVRIMGLLALDLEPSYLPDAARQA